MRKKYSIKNSIFIIFSDEEGYGKYLDLHECYDKYINIKVMDYPRTVNCNTGKFSLFGLLISNTVHCLLQFFCTNWFN